MFDLFYPNHSHINQTDFHALLPTIVYELKTGVCKHNHVHEVAPSTHEFSWRAFLAAIGAVLLVSFSGLIVVCLVPLMSRSFYNVVTQFLIALAVGSLAGDAFLHLIPHAFSDAGHFHHNHNQETIDHEHIDEHHHESMSSKLSSHRKMILEALIALLGIYIFFLTERLTIICQNKMSRRKLERQRSTALNDSQMCNCSPERPMDNSRCVDYLNEKQINGSDGTNQPHWSFNNNALPPLDTVQAVGNNEQEPFGGGVVHDGHYTKPSDLRKSSVHNNNKNINNDNKLTSVINNGRSVVDMLDVKHNSKQNTALELANHANNTPTQIGKSNAILKKNSSFDYIGGGGGGEQIQTHPHRDKPHGHHHGHSHDLSSVRAIAYTIIAGDGLHNFCDGIAIGAAFASDMRGGLSTSIAVLCHELPHELGDFAVLLHAGMSVKSALFYNLLSSILCAAGMIIGFLLGGMHSLDTWIFMLAAGMFIYIALVDMMPELSANQLKGNRRCHQPSVLFIWQNLGIILGYCIMLLIAFYEFEFLSH
uniref:Zinc transporter ZIP10 n=2 Tax=Schistosoma mansoni TaxID=6183 RepID=A0A5K4FC38_SCHMA